MNRTRNLILTLFVFLLAFALRIYQLGAASLWYDETVSVWLARQDLAEITRHTAGDIHPPLYYYLLHFWGLAAGWSEFSVAFLSLVFGMLIVALAYRLAREWFGTRVALLAALLVATSPYNVWYSQEVRMYTLGAWLALAAYYFGARILRAQSEMPKAKSTDWALCILFNVAGLYTLYYFVFFLAFENLVVLVWLIRQWRTTKHLAVANIGYWFGSQLAIISLFAPWLPIAFRQATDPPVPPWRDFTPLQDVLLQSLGALTLGQAVDPLVALPLVIICVIVICYALFAARWHRSLFGFYFLLFTFTFVPLALIFIFSLWKPLYHVRYVFTYSSAFYILLASAIAIFFEPRRLEGTKKINLSLWLGGLVVISVVVGSGYSLYNFWFNPQYATDDLRGAVQHIEANWRPGDVILVNAGYAYTALVYYDAPIASRERLSSYQPRADDSANGALVLMTGSIEGSPSLGWGDPRSDFFATTTEATTAALDRVFATHPRVWMLRIYDTVVDPNGIIRKYFADHATLIDETVYSGEANTRLQGFLTTRAMPNDMPPDATRLNAKFADRVTLVGATSSSGVVSAGDIYDLALYWRAEQLLNYNYHISVQIFDTRGNKVGQVDEEPLGNALPMTRWEPGKIYYEPARVPIDANAAPGEYDVRVVVYNPANGEPLAAPVTVAEMAVK